MNFGFTEEQDLLRQEARKLLEERSPMEAVRALRDSREGYDPALWKQLGELGWLGLVLPEEHGGAELQWIDLAVLLEENGRALCPSPLIPTVLVATTILDAGNEAQQHAHLPGLASGARIASPALAESSDLYAPEGIQLRGEPDGDGFVLDGSKCFVSDPETANLFLVPFRTGDGPDDLALALVEADAAGVETRSHFAMDQTKRTGTVVFSNVRVGADALLGAPGGARPAIERLLDRGATAVCAEIVGAAEAALAMSIQYAKDRTQFGSPIGRFQGVKHPLAEMHLDLESAKSLLYYAAWTLDAAPDDAPRAVSLAKAYASDAFSRIGIDGIQIHGAMGYTDDCDISLFLKRSKWARPAYGDSDHHYERVCALRGL